mgnify:CR=1 FL=1
MKNAQELDIIGGYGKSEFPEFNPEETINLYVESTSDGSKALFPTPGNRLSSRVRPYPFINPFPQMVISCSLIAQNNEFFQ